MDDFDNNNQPQDDQQQNPYGQQPQEQQPQEPYVQQPQEQPQDSYAQQNYQPQQPDTYAQPNYYQQPDQSSYYPQQPEQPKKGMSIASMVLGILSIVFFCAFYIGGPLSIVSLILGIISLKGKKGGKGMAIAGVILSAIGLIIAICMLIFTLYVLRHPEMGTTDFWNNYIEQNS